jgi:twitching motility two-component system response regulator PilG
MQDNLKSPYKLLQVIAQKDLTGCLSISTPQDDSVVWQLYVGGSRLYYATARHHSNDRFDLIWQQIAKDQPLPNFSPDKSEYENLYEWQCKHHIPLTDFRRTLLNMSREALIQAVSHANTHVKFEPDKCVKPVLIAAPMLDLIKPVSNHVRFWQKLHTNIPSPFSRLHLDPSRVKNLISFIENTTNPSLEKSLGQNVSLPIWLELLEQKLSIYEICRQLKIETHILSLWLNPLIEDNVLEVLPSIANAAIASPSAPTGALIACIDDSHTVQQQVKMVLEMSGFRILGITDPASCLSLLVRQKPSLILMDITMPEIDGYELCKMLRQSRHLRNVPIVMFTAREGLIDRMRAQLVGANEYITKPVNAEKLIAKVQRLLENNQNNQSNQNELSTINVDMDSG